MEDKLLFDKIIDRAKTGSVKWDIYSGRDVIPMWVADMDFASPAVVRDALANRIGHGVFGYTWATDQFYEAVVDWVQYRHGWAIKSEWIVPMPGLVSALNVMCRAFAERGEQVITFTPVYHPFLEAPANMNRTLVRCPLKRVDENFTFDIDLFESMITEETKVLLLCSPHNPVGRVWGDDELEAVAEVCLKNNIVICSDEIHCDLILDGFTHTPTASISSDISQNTITLMAPSKTFNVPGLGCAFAIIENKTLRDKFKQAANGIVPYPNALGYTACQAAFNNGRDWHKQLISYLTENSKIVYDTIDSIAGLWCDRVEATYLAWINIEALKLENGHKYFEEAGVGLSDGNEFGDGRFLRLNFGCPRELLIEGLNRIKTAVERLYTL